ncbi:MAG: methyltransferase domain-containing protein [Candidatus Peribacteria bacterium]|jgi:glycosyltransferase involved in cell wall biosynthesis/SAM-dependent methyltransferase|nr:methyltransferase domain-containing protein [Candidatus Peribacteria bacterium]
MSLFFTGERIVFGAENSEPNFTGKMYQEHVCRYYFAAQFVSGKKVLDVGCGVGYGAKLLAQHGAVQIDAFDIDQDAIEYAKQYYCDDKVSYHCASATNFNFGDNKYDVVTCFELIEHVEGQNDVLRNIRRVIKSDGLLVISTPRPLDKKRSQFHVHGLPMREFIELIIEQLPYYRLFSGNNHFMSLITDNLSSSILSPVYMRNQFDLDQADYFICVASTESLDDLKIDSCFVVNDDKYVLLQERDLVIPHETENSVKMKLQERRELYLSFRNLIKSEMQDIINREVGIVYDSICSRLELIDEKISKVDRHIFSQRLLAIYHKYIKTSIRNVFDKIKNPDFKRRKDNIIAGDVVFIYGVEGASKRYRVDNIVEGLKELGFDAEALPENLIHRLETVVKPKVVVFFRCANLSGNLKTAIQSLRDYGVRIYCDFDDLIFEPEIINTIDGVNYLSGPQKKEYARGVRLYRELLQCIASGIASTAFLASRMAQLIDKVAIIPNSLNKVQLDLAERILSEKERKPSDYLTVIYGSGSRTHQKDFSQCVDALAKFLKERRNAKLLIIGELELPSSFYDLKDQIIRKPILPYLELLVETSNADINIAPLEKTAFNDSKSELKIFEAGVVRVPTIATATKSYAACIDDGVDGLLVEPNEVDWYNALCRLADNNTLRESMGIKAREKACAKFNYLRAAKMAVSVYGLKLSDDIDEIQSISTSEKSSQSSKKFDLNHLVITWVLPSLLLNSGGHRNILRAAYYLSKFGHIIKLYIINTDKTARELIRLIRENYYPLHCEVFSSPTSDLDITSSDVVFATHWSTVETIVKNKLCAKELMYFVQDFEPLFAPMSSEYILAENTYRQGLYHITSGPWCERFLKRDFGADADHFQFPVDRDIYYPRERVKTHQNIVFFAKPEMPRRCYELGIATLKEFHSYMPKTEIIFFGSNSVDKNTVPFPITLLAALPTLENLANLYSNADLGLVFSTTNPSLVPYEMMACGLNIVDLDRGDNHYNYGERYDIALLADPRPKVMATQMIDLLNNREEMAQRRKNGIEFVKSFPMEEEMARRVENLIKTRLIENFKRMKSNVN